MHTSFFIYSPCVAPQADLVRTPGDIFTYMSTNKVGERLALFWIAWAYVAEKAQNYKLADQIFQKGKGEISVVVALKC
jgi:hypothetical protein